MDEMTCTRAQARRFLLQHQGLWPPRALSGPAGVLAFLRRVRCIQFDPLDVVGRNPDLVLQSRVGDFRPEMLSDLLYCDRLLLDGWDKQMSIVCTEDWPFFSRQRAAARTDPRQSAPPILASLPAVRRELQERGPLSSLDLALDESIDWHWAPTRLARAALESMYFWGELVVHHKVRTRKVYDFAQNCLPPKLLAAPEPNPDEAGYHDWYVRRRLGSVGLLADRPGDAWLGIEGLKTPERRAALSRLVAAGQVAAVRLEESGDKYYLRAEDLTELAAAGREAAGTVRHEAAILAPLDNLLWDRRMLAELFGFAYRWEVYKPAAERTYGYYVLPVLAGDRFVARFEPGRDRAARSLIIRNWWWEPGVEPSPTLVGALTECFTKFIEYLGAERMALAADLREREDLAWLPGVDFNRPVRRD